MARCAIRGGDPDHRRAFDTETKARTGPEADIEAAGCQRLLQLSIAPEARYRYVEAFALEYFRIDSNLGCPESERVRHCLAETDGVEGKGGRDEIDKQHCNQSSESMS